MCAYRYPIVTFKEISSGTYVQNKSYVRVFLVDLIIHICMNLILERVGVSHQDYYMYSCEGYVFSP